MKQWAKVLSILTVTLVVVGSITLLAIKYFDVLVSLFDNIRSSASSKKNGLFSDECCDCCLEEETEPEL